LIFYKINIYWWITFHFINPKKIIDSTTNKLFFIPPYCPDFDPIENVFHVLKNKIDINLEKDINLNKKNIIMIYLDLLLLMSHFI
jgi:transposase